MWSYIDAQDFPASVKQAILYLVAGWGCYLFLFYLTFYDQSTERMFYSQAGAGAIIIFGLVRKKYWGRMFGIVFTMIVGCITVFFLFFTFGRQPLEQSFVAAVTIGLMAMGIYSLMLKPTKAFYDAQKPKRPDPNQAKKN